MSELKLGIPKGSLEEMTIELFKKSGWKISTTSRSYFPSIDDPTIRCSLARPQEMSRYVEMGTLDVAITGKDWVLENQSDIQVVCEMVYSKTSFRPTRWVLAVPQDSPIQKIEDLKGKRISSEMVNFTKRYFAERKFPWRSNFPGAPPRPKPPKVSSMRSSKSLKPVARSGLMVSRLFMSSWNLARNSSPINKRGVDPWKRAKIEQIKLLLLGALSAENKVGIKLNVPERDLEKVIELIPSITAPTVAPLHPSPNLKGIKWYSVESVLEETKVRDLIPQLIQAGAVGIIEYPLNKII